MDSLIQKSRTTSLPGFSKIPVYDVVRFFWHQIQTVGMNERASSISFNIVMAIPPAVMFLFTLIPFMPISKEFEEGIYELIREIIPGEENNAKLIAFLKDFINKPRTGLLSFGFLLSLYFSSSAITGMQRSFDRSLKELKKRSEWQSRLGALRITLILYLIVLLCVMLLIAQGKLLQWMAFSESFRNIFLITRWFLIVLLYFTVISILYRYVPAVEKKWPLINPGSVTATILMLLTSFVFSWWVSRFNSYNQLYGSIGTVMLIMALIYVNSLVLIIGYELNVSISTLKNEARRGN
ncbi:MAG: YihY/virulence factor BrkB family protein [Chitinophagaceae bacterium]|nr:YihY/virulence factor BrkB family protein [Chitinophagaceae bacterium]